MNAKKEGETISIAKIDLPWKSETPSLHSDFVLPNFPTVLRGTGKQQRKNK